MASSLEKILASAGKANTNKQAQVVVNNGTGRVNLPVGTDASKLTGQDVQRRLQQESLPFHFPAGIHAIQNDAGTD